MSDAGNNTDNEAYLVAVAEAEALLQLNELDIRLLKLKKQFETMPQRREILELRAKQRDVGAKQEQIAKMRADTDSAIALLQEKEKETITQQKKTQAKLEESSDYKKTSALSRELESLTKKKEKIELETLKHMEKLDKITEIEAQAAGTLLKLKEQEGKAIEGFKAQGGLLQSTIAHDTTARENLAARLPVALLARYEKAVVAKGGIGAAHIEDGHCSACRMPYSEGQVVKFRASGPLAECPHCHRLLVTKGFSHEQDD